MTLENFKETIVVVSGSFDNVKTADIRFLQEASRLGYLHVLLFSDKAVETLSGKAPNFPEAERRYFLESIRFVKKVTMIPELADLNVIPKLSQLQTNASSNIIWAVREQDKETRKKMFYNENHLEYQVISEKELEGYPLESQAAALSPSKKRVVVTGSFDWLHSGHVRFFEEAAELGELFVIVGHDGNIKLLKGEGHPLFNQSERQYMVQSVRFVYQSLISTGHGWMDAEPEIEQIKPDYYIVNEDGDKPEKREFCINHGIEYKVLKRLPKPGLPRRESTALRGF